MLPCKCPTALVNSHNLPTSRILHIFLYVTTADFFCAFSRSSKHAVCPAAEASACAVVGFGLSSCVSTLRLSDSSISCLRSSPGYGSGLAVVVSFSEHVDFLNEFYNYISVRFNAVRTSAMRLVHQ